MNRTLLTAIMLCAGSNAFSMDVPRKEKSTKELSYELFTAIKINNLDQVDSLISAKADVNYQKNDGWGQSFPLFEAAADNYLDIVQSLLAARANPNQASLDNEFTALGVAAIRDGSSTNQAIIKALIMSNADVNQATTSGHTPLIGATQQDCSSNVKLLIESGADVYAANRNGQTALIRYMGYSHQDTRTIQVLLDAITQLNPQEKTSIKTWLILTRKMQIKHGIFIPKDIRILIAHQICQSLAQNLFERVIRAGGLKTLEIANQRIENERHWRPDPALDSSIQLLKECLHQSHLIKLVRQQTKWAEFAKPETQAEENNIVTETIKKLKITKEIEGII